MQSEPASPEELDRLEARIDAWLLTERADNPAIAAVERGSSDERRWYIRLHGEDKEAWTAWWTLGQRTLRFETFLLPAPQANNEAFYAHLLRRNRELTGMAFEIGAEEAIFLGGSLPVGAITDVELDRILGSMWAYVERVFRSALKIGFPPAATR